MPEASDSQVLGIIAGSGRLPAQLVESCKAMGRPCVVIALEGFADMDGMQDVPHAVVRLGAVGEALEQLRKHHAKELVLAGKVRRPGIAALRPDMCGTKLLARLGAAFFSGDDALLKAVVSFLEDEGFTVVGANDILKGLLATEGVLGNIKPESRFEADIAHGLRVAKKLGELDIGQAAIVENGYVLGVEAAEGTDALIERCGKLRRELRNGVLVKARKPQQEDRVDLPAIGIDTVEKIHAAGFAGIAVEAGGAIIVDRERTLKKADDLGLFIIGVRYG